MFTIIPLPYRILLILVVAVALGAYGYLRGRIHGQEQLDAVVSKMQAAGELQNTHTAETIIQQKTITGDITHEAETLRHQLTIANAGLRVRIFPAASGSGIMPAISPTAARTDAPAAESGSCTPGTTPEELERASQDALTVLLLQSWILRQQSITQEVNINVR